MNQYLHKVAGYGVLIEANITSRRLGCFYLFANGFCQILMMIMVVLSWKFGCQKSTLSSSNNFLKYE